MVCSVYDNEGTELSTISCGSKCIPKSKHSLGLDRAFRRLSYEQLRTRQESLAAKSMFHVIEARKVMHRGSSLDDIGVGYFLHWEVQASMKLLGLGM